ncbi:MAG: hypothetical protein N2745_06550 [Syntrophorhabdaceae bacterium]|nr:hypothetical protein [Syntrophorhabdaceae bacterium]
MKKYNPRAKNFFTEDEKKRIEKAIIEAESKTIGEIAIVMVDKSDDYLEGDFLGATLFSAIFSLVLTETVFHWAHPLIEDFFHDPLWFFIPFAILFFYPIRLILRGVPQLKKPFVSKKRMLTAVKKTALISFYGKGLYKTKGQTGVLIFLSLFEHMVWVMADRGIYEKISQSKLNEIALSISKGIKEKRACDALCQAIFETGELLSRHFPIEKGDENEIPNRIFFDSMDGPVD